MTPEATISADPTIQPLVLNGRLDTAAAGQMLSDFKQRRGQAVQIDASEVEFLGAQCFQILLSAAHTWRLDGLSLTLFNFSPAVSEALERFGAPGLSVSPTKEMNDVVDDSRG